MQANVHVFTDDGRWHSDIPWYMRCRKTLHKLFLGTFSLPCQDDASDWEEVEQACIDAAKAKYPSGVVYVY